MVASPRVVDASALAAMVFGEPQGAEVAKRLGSNLLAAPSLLRYELGSVCLKKIRIYPDKRAQLLDALDLAERLDIQEIDVPIGPTIELAEKTGLSVYDTSYLWLAHELRTGLVTLDAALARAATELAIPLPR